MMEIVSMEMAVVQVAQLRIDSFALVEMNLLQITAMNGAEMASDTKTLGFIIQEEIYLGFKK